MGLLIEVIGFGLLMLGITYWIRTAKVKPVKPQATEQEIINEFKPKVD